MVEARSPPRLSPRKRKAQKPLGNGFFGIKSTPSRATTAAAPSSSIPSSSPAFATPAHTLRPFNPPKPTVILPILLPPATLRPLAFRTFTKKHSLTLTSSALQELAAFVGRHCGSGWREEGLAEPVLEEVARSWKGCNGGVIVDGSSSVLKDILRTLEGNMSGGKIVTGGGGSSSAGTTGPAGGGAPGAKLSRQNSLLLDPARESDHSTTRLGLRPANNLLQRQESSASLGMSALAVGDADDDEFDDESLNDPRSWLKVVDAFQQPRMVYNVAKKHFERDVSKPSLFPDAAHKTVLFRNRYNVIHQRLLRNEAFQTSAVADTKKKRAAALTRSTSSLGSQQHSYKITPIANLLGRHGSHHMLLGMLLVMPAGNLAVADPSGTIALDLSRAVAIPEDSAWFAPGMIVLVDGVYEEDGGDDDGRAAGGTAGASGSGLSGGTGIGGTVGGRFQGFFVGQPPCEKRSVTLGVSGADGTGVGQQEHAIGGGFGWIDFLGVGSERAVGPRMRRLERRILRKQQHQIQKAQKRLLSDQDLPSSSVAAPPAADEAGDENTDGAGVSVSRRGRVVVLGELNLDQPRALQALRKVLATYAAEEPEDGDGSGETDSAEAGAAESAAPPPSSSSAPMAFVLVGNFASQAVMARNGTSSSASGGGSIEYKEYFDSLAGALADFPTLLRESTFVFVPGDNDGWASAFAGGAAVPLPRKSVPELFTSRVRRAFATASAEGGGSGSAGEVVFTTNPSRLSLFGPGHEIVLFRDDITARLRRTAVRLKGSVASGAAEEAPGGEDVSMSGAVLQSADDGDRNRGAMDLDGPEGGDPVSDIPADGAQPVETATADGASPLDGGIPHDVRAARKLVKTLLDQGYLAPFRTSVRPVHWDHATALHLYPLPTAVVVVDATAPPFCVTYEGCHVMNPGPLLVAGRRGVARWLEYEVGRTGTLRECLF